MFGGLTRLGSLRAATDRPENMRQARDAPRRILIASRSKNRHASQFRECFDRTFLGKRPSLWLTDATLDDRLPDLFHLPRFIGHFLPLATENIALFGNDFIFANCQTSIFSTILRLGSLINRSSIYCPWRGKISLLNFYETSFYLYRRKF